MEKKTYTERDLVKFGNYLLSDQRNKRIFGKNAEDRRKQVSDADIANSGVIGIKYGRVIQLNSQLSKENIRLIEELDRSNRIEKLFEKLYQECVIELSSIKQKWWYKLMMWEW